MCLSCWAYDSSLTTVRPAMHVVSRHAEVISHRRLSGISRPSQDEDAAAAATGNCLHDAAQDVAAGHRTSPKH